MFYSVGVQFYSGKMDSLSEGDTETSAFLYNIAPYLVSQKAYR